MVLSNVALPEEVEGVKEGMNRTRLILLCGLCLVMVGCMAVLRISAPAADSERQGFVWTWIGCFLPYLGACLVVLKMPGGRSRRQIWLEIGVILLGALVMRLLFVPVEPNLSRDSWRYLWDARVTLQGYSPYVHPPGSPIFAQWRDFIYDNSRFRNVPTIYPPVAQGFFLLSYLVAPSNLMVLKGLLVICEMVTCGVLAWVLYRRESDPALCLIYAWCPLPIVEFALQGHVDALTIMFSVLALASVQLTWWGGRIGTGILLACATLTKLYPMLFLCALVRKRDWSLIIACTGAILLAYVPYIIIGKGQVLGFFATYASEYTPNAGLVQHLVWNVGDVYRWSEAVRLRVMYGLDLLVVGGSVIGVLVARARRQLSIEGGILIITGSVFCVSSHIFPWYTAALLPWIVLLVGRKEKRGNEWGRSLAIGIAWYFACIVVIAYFFDGKPDWSVYYGLAYAFVVVGLCGVVGAGLVRTYRYKKSIKHVR